MMTMYVVCFLAGVALSALSFISGLHHFSFFGHHHVLGRGHAHHLFRGHAHQGHGHVQAQAHAHGQASAQANANAQGDAPASASTHTSSINLAAMTAFLAWFGGAGIVLQQMTHWVSGIVMVSSVLIGIAGGAVVNRFTNTLAGDDQPLLPAVRVGLPATVTSPIRAGGTGEIVYALGGTRQTSGARCEDGAAIGKGQTVVITRYEKGIAYVSTFEELSAITRES
jgi:membrane protein implicated in regulation of membrane protease activity